MLERQAYNPSFDRRDYLRVSFNKEEQERLTRFIDKQIDTHIGERFNVLISKDITYEVVGGQLFGKDTTEPFLEIMKRGVVSEREEAEIRGFEKVQDFANSAEDGEMMLSVSPPGGEYLHNFYDVFTVRREGDKKFLDLARYSSGLTRDEYKEKLKPLKNFEKTPTDIELLEEPIRVNTILFPQADDLHRYLHKEHDYLTKEEFDQIITTEAMGQLKLNYHASLSKDVNTQNMALNAIYNHADMARHAQQKGYGDDFKLNANIRRLTQEEIYTLGTQPVRTINTACGISGGFSVENAQSAMRSPFRVFDKTNNKTQEWFTCPKCTYKADGPIGNKCPGCGITKEEFSEEGGITCD